MGTQDFRFGPYLYDGQRNGLFKNTLPVVVGQRCLAILAALLRASGKPVSKSDLLLAAWGTENVEESNLSVQISALRKAIGRRRDGSEWIATVQRVGYQIAADLNVPQTIGETIWPGTATAEVSLPSLAVLPFRKLSAASDHEFVADGLAEDIITTLSKMPGLRVIARHSSFVFRDTAYSALTIARELSVGFVVEGSIQFAADRLRINCHLVDVSKSTTVWANRFDGTVHDVFALQDRVVAEIVTALPTIIPSGTIQRKRREPLFEAYELFVQGRLFSLQSPEGNKMARPLLERACALDESFAEAHAWLAMNLNFGWMYCYEEDARHRVQSLAERAILLEPENADAHVVLGYVHIFNGKAELSRGGEQFRRAIEINHNHADAWMFSADLEVLEGRPEKALKMAERAFELNPLPPSYYYWLLTWVLYSARHYDQVVALQTKDLPHSIGFHRNLAASLAQLGRLEEARESARQFLELVPRFTISSWLELLPFRNAEDAEHFREGYRKAGFPD